MSGSSFKPSPLCAEISPFCVLPKFLRIVNKKTVMNVPISLQNERKEQELDSYTV